LRECASWKFPAPGLKPKVGSATDQHREFVKAARDLGTDESEEAFDKVLRKVASAPPPATVRQRKADIERRKQLVAGKKRKLPKR
jgi:hypothetical protein